MMKEWMRSLGQGSLDKNKRKAKDQAHSHRPIAE
jgi:hypothetical protein